MNTSMPAWTLAATVILAAAVAAQAPPELSRQQRDTLKELMSAVDAAAASPANQDHRWQTHVLRTSDGSHYVAFSIEPPATALPDRPVVLYVRLATAIDPGTTPVAERSAVREWLQGSRIDPRMLPPKGMAVGDMPALGAGAVGVRGAASVGSADLQMLALERERARQRKEDQERDRRAALAGGSDTKSSLLPFEDFAVGPPAAFGDGTRIIQRALTAGPGRYTLFVAWADPAARGSTRLHVARRELQLGPSVPTEFSVSNVIVADKVAVREVAYTPLEQRAHPYSIGATEISPAHDSALRPDERLAVAFQVINPSATPDGKPSVLVNLRLARVDGTREQQVAQLTPLVYDPTTLPPDFDARLGHPIIAAMSIPLSTLARGSYRLNIAAQDRISGMVARSGADFTIVATPSSVLAEAPPLRPAFSREAALDRAIVANLIDALAPAVPSPPLSRALATARAGRLGELLAEEPVPPQESGVRSALTGLALLSVGEASSTGVLQRALQQNAPPAPVQFLLGASWAMQSRDLDALTVWQASRAAGGAPAITPRLMIEACLRRADYVRAAAMADELGPGPADGPWRRAVAFTYIATQREADALAVLAQQLSAEPGDQDAQWLQLHALYARLVRSGATASAADRARFLDQAKAYVDSEGVNASLLSEWVKVIS